MVDPWIALAAEGLIPALHAPPMNLDSLRKYCATLPGATRDVKWGADEVYSVGGKMFAVFCVDLRTAASD